MPRAIWSGSISFGLISLPVKAYSAVSKQRIDFDMLHDEDGARIEYKRVCSVDGAEVPWEHIVKGYEIRPGTYVTFTKEELEELQPEATHTVDIEDFVKLEQIDPMFFDAGYHLLPDTGAKRAYDLLYEVMVDAQVVAVARVVMRTRERLVAIRPLPGGTLAMATMHFADEIREVPQPKQDGRTVTAPTEREIAMARTLVDELTAEFEPDRYEDTWRQRLVERIEQKAAGETVVAPSPDEPAPTPANDIMAALEASLAAARASRGGGRGTGTRGTSGGAATSTKAAAKPKAAGKPKATAKSKPAGSRATAAAEQ